jgi:hypothetical protein
VGYRRNREEAKSTIKDVRATIWHSAGPAKPLPPNSYATPSDLIAGQDGDLFPFSFRGWLIVEIERVDGTIGIGTRLTSWSMCT